jgi:hypothetical protein
VFFCGYAAKKPKQKHFSGVCKPESPALQSGKTLSFMRMGFATPNPPLCKAVNRLTSCAWDAVPSPPHDTMPSTMFRGGTSIPQLEIYSTTGIIYKKRVAYPHAHGAGFFRQPASLLVSDNDFYHR